MLADNRAATGSIIVWVAIAEREHVSQWQLCPKRSLAGHLCYIACPSCCGADISRLVPSTPKQSQHALQGSVNLLDDLIGASKHVGEMVSPSSLAAFRLSDSSYLVGACTGRSPGFSPLRMRSTYSAAFPH